MIFGELKARKGFRKKIIPILFIDDECPLCKEPLYVLIERKYGISLEQKYARYSDFIIPDSIFDMICESMGRDPIEERKNLLRKYWEDIQKVLDK
jgi:hypothetical protein